MPQRTAEEWAGYIKAAIEAAQADGALVYLDWSSCGSGCCYCEDPTLEVSVPNPTTLRYDDAEVSW
jgi:hypothetical protein